MTVVYGLTDQGFVLKPLTVIRDELNAGLQNAFGVGIDVSDRSVFGVVAGILAERLSLLWELLEQITSAQDPSKATGTLLDALAALTGTLRLEALQSTVTLTLCGTATTVVPSSSQAQTSAAGSLFETTADATLDLVDPWTPTTAYLLGDRVTNDSGKVYQNIQAGTSAGSGGPAGTTPDVTPDGGALWTFIGTGNGAVDVAAVSVDFGPIIGSARDIDVIATPIGGWETVVNLEDADEGRTVQKDAELRTLRNEELGVAGSATLDALQARLLNVSGATSVTLFPNNTDVTDVDGVPPHSVEALIQGGTDDAVRSALLANVAAGIGTHGNITGTVFDSQLTPHTVSFSRPVTTTIYVKISVTVDPTSYPTDGDNQVTAAIVSYGAQQSTGRDVVPSALASQAFTVDGVLDVSRVLVYTDLIQDPVAWAPTTAYVATPLSRSVVSNDNGRVYICITSGTSAGSGGPTGTGSNITDGTAHWAYIQTSIVLDSRHLAEYSETNTHVISSSGTP